MAEALDAAAYAERIRRGSRADVARAITLVESTREDHRELTHRLLALLAPFTGGALRLGVSGVPGSGKSTFIDALGSRLTEAGHRVAVLAVDPSSSRTGGSILGDKTRMSRLANDSRAFVRPSATSGRLGGVARATREAMVVMEAAGYDVVVVETVGVGQSEVAVAGMVDTFLLLALARAGDQLQGIKKGILELADVIAVNKADGRGEADARSCARELAGALRLVQRSDPGWRVPVLTCSALLGTGLDDVWEAVQRHRDHLVADGSLERRRREQQVQGMWATLTDELLARLHRHRGVRAVVADVEAQVRNGSLAPSAGAAALLHTFQRRDDD